MGEVEGIIPFLDVDEKSSEEGWYLTAVTALLLQDVTYSLLTHSQQTAIIELSEVEVWI